MLQNILQISRHGIDLNNSTLYLPSPNIAFSQPRITTELYDKFTNTEIQVIEYNALDACLNCNTEFTVTLWSNYVPGTIDDILSRTLIYDTLVASKFKTNDILRIDNIDIVYDKGDQFIYPYPISVVLTVNYKHKWNDIIRACFGSDILVLNVDNMDWDDDFKSALILADKKFRSIIITSKNVEKYQVFDRPSVSDIEEIVVEESVVNQVLRAYPYVLADAIKWFLDMDFKEFKGNEYFEILFPIPNPETGLDNMVMEELSITSLPPLIETAIKLFYSFWGLTIAENDLEITNYQQFENYFATKDTSSKLKHIFKSLAYFPSLADYLELTKKFISQIAPDYPDLFEF